MRESGPSGRLILPEKLSVPVSRALLSGRFSRLWFIFLIDCDGIIRI